MKFKFPFEHVLDFRKQNENAARRDYVETLDKLEIEKARLKQMYVEWDAATGEVFEIQHKKSSPLARILYLNSFIDGQRIKTQRLREVIQNIQMIVESKHEILLAAVKEYEIIAKLKENQVARFKKQAAKKEAKQMDEMVVTRYRRREGV